MNNLATIKPNGNTLTKNGITNSIQQGNGTPVILIHGLAASLFDWNALIPELSKNGFSAYALDLLGHGESVKPVHLCEYNVESVFTHFSAWIDTLDLDQPLTLIGHSLGGYIATQYALRYPQRVRALVLGDPFLSPEQLPLLLRLSYRRPIINTALIEHTPEWLFRRVIDLTSLSIRNGFVLPESVRIQTASDYKRAHPGIFNIVHSIKDLSSQLSSIAQPTFVIWGAHDQTLAPDSFVKFLKQIPRAKGTSIIGAGHVPHQSHPVEFNQQVMHFLRSLDYIT